MGSSVVDTCLTCRRPWVQSLAFPKKEKKFLRVGEDFLGVIAMVIFLNCCAGWGYIVACTKVLTVYQMYQS
jgi:hypothetical protein